MSNEVYMMLVQKAGPQGQEGLLNVGRAFLSVWLSRSDASQIYRSDHLLSGRVGIGCLHPWLPSELADAGFPPSSFSIDGTEHLGSND
jgi:hypothetical protein